MDDLGNVEVEIPPTLIKNPSGDAKVEVSSKHDNPYINDKVNSNWIWLRSCESGGCTSCWDSFSQCQSQCATISC